MGLEGNFDESDLIVELIKGLIFNIRLRLEGEANLYVLKLMRVFDGEIEKL